MFHIHQHITYQVHMRITYKTHMRITYKVMSIEGNINRKSEN